MLPDTKHRKHRDEKQNNIYFVFILKISRKKVVVGKLGVGVGVGVGQSIKHTLIIVSWLFFLLLTIITQFKQHCIYLCFYLCLLSPFFWSIILLVLFMVWTYFFVASCCRPLNWFFLLLLYFAGQLLDLEFMFFVGFFEQTKGGMKSQLKEGKHK